MTIPIIFIALVWVGLGLTAAAPGIVGGDSPELTAAAFHLGSAHPPGYPLFLALGRLFQLLPVGTMAFRMTFFSILVQSAAFLILARTLRDISSPAELSPTPGEGSLGGPPSTQGSARALTTASLVFAGPLVFHQLVSPEVFALHLLFVTVLLRLVLFPAGSNLFKAGFITGVALSHQQLTLLLLPALGWAYRAHFKDAKRLALAFAFLVPGLSPYLLLTLRAVQGPLVNWGNPVNFHQLLFHITRAQYGGDITRGTLLNGVWDFYLYARDFVLESFGLGIALLLLGLWKGRRVFNGGYYIGGFCLFILLPFLLRVPYNPENNAVDGAFLTPALLWLSPLMLKGLEWVYGKAGGAGKWITAVLVCFAAALAGFSSHSLDSSRNFAVEDVGRDILSQLPARSVLFSEGDAITFPLAYLNLVLGLRPDLAIFDRTGGLFKNLYPPSDDQKIPGNQPIQQVLVEKNYGQTRHPTAVFYTENTDVPGRALTMTGLLFQALPEGGEQPPDSVLWGHFQVPRASPNHDYFSRETAARYYLFKAPYDLDIRKDAARGTGDLRKGTELGFDNSRLWLNAGLVETGQGWDDQAALSFEKASLLTPDYYLAWYDRGVVAELQKRYTEAEFFFQKAAKLDPGYAQTHLHLGFLYHESRRFDEAVGEWERALELDPLNAEACRNLGYAYRGQQPGYAAQMFRRYLLLAPHAPDKGTVEKWLSDSSGRGLKAHP